MSDRQLLLKALRGDISWQSLPIPLEGLTVAIEPSDLIPMLERYMSGDVSSVQLQSWAAWALSTESFETPGWMNDEVADHFEPMWNVLQQLSAPYVDGQISIQSVRLHLAVLAAL